MKKTENPTGTGSFFHFGEQGIEEGIIVIGQIDPVRIRGKVVSVMVQRVLGSLRKGVAALHRKEDGIHVHSRFRISKVGQIGFVGRKPQCQSADLESSGGPEIPDAEQDQEQRQEKEQNLCCFHTVTVYK